MLANDINFISFIDLKQVSPGLNSLLEVIPLTSMFTPSLWISIAAAAVEVNIASDPHASSSITWSGILLSKRNLFSPFKSAFSPAKGSNCLNKKPIKIIINEAIAANTCALSSSGVIISIEIKFKNKLLILLFYLLL